jgi:hypothetical protein
MIILREFDNWYPSFCDDVLYPVFHPQGTFGIVAAKRKIFSASRML